MSLPLRILSHWVRPRLQHVILHVTDRCNLRCKHCFVDLTEKNTLTASKARELADDIGSLLWLDVAGGEPFLLDELPELIEPFDCEILGIPTNGHYPERTLNHTRRLLAAGPKRDVVISVSIEGFREQHNAIRINAQNYDLAFDTLNALRELADREPRLKVKCNTVITNKNIDHLLPFMRHMRGAGLIDFHSVILLRGDPFKPDVELPYVARLRAMRRDIFKILDSYLWGSAPLKRGFLRRYYRYLWDASLETLETQTQVIPCTAGETHLVIWANGDVASCELLPAIGNIYKNSVTEILRNDALKNQITDIRAKKCACTHNCVMLDSILFNPASYPRLLAANA